MPLALWLLLGGVAAFLVVKSAQSAAATAVVPSAPGAGTGTVNLSIFGPLGVGPFVVPVETSLPTASQQQFLSFFLHADDPSFTDQKVLDFSNQLAMAGFSIAAGSVQSVWEMIIAAYNALPQPSSSACPPGYEPAPFNKYAQQGMGGPHCVQTSSSGGGGPLTIGPIMRTSQGFTFQQAQSLTTNPPKQK